MKMAESGQAQDPQPVVFQGGCAPAPQGPRASNAPVLNATGASRGWGSVGHCALPEGQAASVPSSRQVTGI